MKNIKKKLDEKLKDTLNEKLKDTLNEFKPKKIDVSSVQSIVYQYIDNFEHINNSVLFSLMAIGNLLKHLAEFCKNNENKWNEIISDPVLELPAAYAVKLFSNPSRSNIKEEIERLQNEFEKKQKEKDEKI